MPDQLDDESLVAYLDGELPAAEAAAIKQAAEVDEQVKLRLGKLQDSWSFLDDLPEEKLNQRVAQSTLEMVTMAIENAPRSWMGWLARFRLPIVLAAALVALGAGIVFSQATTLLRDRATLENLPFVINFEKLLNLPSVEFLELLTENESLTNMSIQAGSKPSADLGSASRGVFKMSLDERREWIEQLEPVAQQQLAEKLRNFKRLPQYKLERAAELGQHISAHQDRASEYIAAINAYHQLVHNNTGFAVAMDDAVALGDRKAQIDRLNEELAFQYELTDDDRYALSEWASDVYWDLGTMLGDMETEQLVLIFLTTYEATSPEASLYLERLNARLEGRARTLFEAIDVASRRDVALAWLSIASEPKGRSLDPAVLRERFDKATTQRQRDLLLLPADVVRGELMSPVSP